MFRYKIIALLGTAISFGFALPASAEGWETEPAANARSIAPGPNQTVWVISNGTHSGDSEDYAIVSQPESDIGTDNGWTLQPGGAVQIASSPDTQNPWVINHTGAIYEWTGSGWYELSGCAKSIGVGPNNTAWVLGCTNVGGGNYQSFKWVGYRWEMMTNPNGENLGSGTQIAVDGNGTAWVVNSSGQVYYTSSQNGESTTWSLYKGGQPSCVSQVSVAGDAIPSAAIDCGGNVWANNNNGTWQQWGGQAIAIWGNADAVGGLMWLAAPNGQMCYYDGFPGNGWCAKNE
jgi:hypothetical protein